MNELLIPALILLLIYAASAGLFLFLRRRREEPELLEFDGQEGHDFEYYCADLLRRNGFSAVEVTRGSGDFGADILAEKDDVTYAVQCKNYSGPVGVSAVQEIAAGRDYYDRMVGVVMTNQFFTVPAKKAAGKLKIILWDRDRLQEMMEF